MYSPMSLAPTSLGLDASGSGKSRRSSVMSTGSSGGLSKSRSLLSNGDGSSNPVISGNLTLVGGFECGEQVLCVKNVENGSALVAGLLNGQMKVYHNTNGNLLATLDPEEVDENLKSSFPLSRIRCKPFMEGSGPNSLLAATYVSGHLRIWNHATGQCLAQARDEDTEREYLCLSHNPFVDVIAVGLDNGGIKLYDEKTMQVVSLLQKSLSPSKVNGHTDRVLCIANHPLNPHEFVSSGWDNTLQFWDARSPNSVHSILGAFVCGEGLCFGKKGQELLIASWMPQNQLKILDYSSRKVLENIESHPTSHYLTGAQFLGKEHILTSSSNQGQVRVIDRQKKASIATLNNIPHVYDMDVARKNIHHTNTLHFTITSNHNLVTIEFKK